MPTKTEQILDNLHHVIAELNHYINQDRLTKGLVNDPQYIGTQWFWSKPKSQVVNPPSDLEQSAYDLDHIKAIFANNNYKWNDEQKLYNVNIVGVRTADQTVNVFNDVMLLFYYNKGAWVQRRYQITTDPGLSYLGKYMINSEGTAILVPGQYKDKYSIRKHRNDYEALCQKFDTSVRVYRDRDHNGRLNFDAPIATAGGINIHRADKNGKIYQVGPHSAGCQVFQDPKDFDAFMAVCYKYKELYGNSFTYTLLGPGDFK